jgi:hypothetical protein
MHYKSTALASAGRFFYFLIIGIIFCYFVYLNFTII